MTKFFLSSVIAATFMFASFTTANATVSSSTKTTVKKVKAEGDTHKFKNADGTHSVFEEQADGSWVFICRC
ncbi:hypothetical protein Fleli_3182 [Bernardetia litoralis DSM 6794]|uniref:Uncharacterized protein n=1 Tax=Bernardetia litoralis (strain ATCC 23117 / DSM 6794 / NBRC 15988 / NCIMB 1366 / Fx l1 / Sio-4) TaxID=880071 RepID=I4ANH9_BERLS|nr:hypothetical protein [Bernardetia litoralis]AFM05514.1 hypothetical protein Fleli_3182 [Bernardetia litoralis DSM 6794]